MLAMKPSIQALRTLLLLLALTNASSLAGCQHTHSSVNSNAAETPNQWEGNYRGGRSGSREPGGLGDH